MKTTALPFVQVEKAAYIFPMRSVYLDHTATTPLDSRVEEAMKPYFGSVYGNASSIHRYGREARAALDAARDTIAKMLHASSAEIFFLSSGTEADNTALKGVVKALKKNGKNHIITTKAEHHAILETCKFLEEEGIDVTYLNVDSYGMVNPDDVRQSIKSDTAVVSIMHANNEVGTINPISEIAALARAHDVYFHTDAVQSFCKLPLHAQDIPVDLLSLSAHKIYGPKGIGALYIRRGTVVDRFMHGGGQERGRRAGTENVPAAVGFATAATIMMKESQQEQIRLLNLKRKFRSMLEERFSYILFNGHPELSLPHILNISFDSSKIQIDGEALLFNMDLAGIAVTSGSACTSGSIEPSHVLFAMGRDPKTAKATIRFSMGRSTTEEDVLYTVSELEKIVKKIAKPTL